MLMNIKRYIGFICIGLGICVLYKVLQMLLNSYVEKRKKETKKAVTYSSQLSLYILRIIILY